MLFLGKKWNILIDAQISEIVYSDAYIERRHQCWKCIISDLLR